METVEQALCHCGRELGVTHCPACGSRNSYALRPRKDGNGRPVILFVCRRCGLEYNKDQPCEAPAYVSKSAQRELDRKMKQSDRLVKQGRGAMLAQIFSAPEIQQALSEARKRPAQDRATELRGLFTKK